MLVVPNIKNNLVSISQLTCDYSCYVTFNDHGFLIKDQATHQVMLLGTKKAGLYVLENAAVKALFSNRFHVVDADTWHGRLGHHQPIVLSFLQHNKFISVTKKTFALCKSYALSKSSKLPFFVSNNKACSPIAKIHCDLRGPAPLLSNQGFHYYAIFVDDFSCFSWIYPLENK